MPHVTQLNLIKHNVKQSTEKKGKMNGIRCSSTEYHRPLILWEYKTMLYEAMQCQKIPVAGN